MITTLLIDSDSCPKQVRSIILKACMKKNLKAIFAADRMISDVSLAIAEHTRMLRDASGLTDKDQRKAIKSPISMVVVETGDNSADDYLVDVCTEASLAITRDILLASRLIAKGAIVLDDRGNRYDSSNIKTRLSEKNNNSVFREAGLFEAEQTKPLTQKDIHSFACAFDKELSK